MNPYAGQLVSAMTMTEVWTQNDFRVHNTSGTTPVIVDVAGTMEFYPAMTPPSVTGSPARAATARATGTDLDGRAVLRHGAGPSRPMPGR